MDKIQGRDMVTLHLDIEEYQLILLALKNFITYEPIGIVTLTQDRKDNIERTRKEMKELYTDLNR